jgi:hypothetical protein
MMVAAPAGPVLLVGLLNALLVVGVLLHSVDGSSSTLAAQGAAVAPKYYSCVSGSCKLNSQTSGASSSTSSSSSTSASTSQLSQNVCLLTCGQGNLWPYPNGETLIGDSVDFVRLGSFTSTIGSQLDYTERGKRILNFAYEQLARNVVVNPDKINPVSSDGRMPLNIRVNVADKRIDVANLANDESYSLSLQRSNNTVLAVIDAVTVFGARHGVETLSQLITFDPLSESFVVASDVMIKNDSPQFPYRGLMLDVSRHYLSVKSIKRSILAMVGLSNIVCIVS